MNKLSLKAKLYLLATTLLLFMFGVGVVGYFTAEKISKEYSKVSNFSFPNTTNLLNELVQLRNIRVNLLMLVLPYTEDATDKAAIEGMAKARAKAQEYEKAYLEVPFAPGEEALYNKFKELRTKLEGLYEEELELYNKNSKDDSPQRIKMIGMLQEDINPLAAEMQVALDKLIEFHKNLSNQNIASAESAKKSGIATILILISLSTLFGIIIAYTLSTNLVKTFSSLAQIISNSSEQVTSSASQIASSSDELSQASTEQAASLQETSSSIEEISKMINNNTNNAEEANSISSECLAFAEDGKLVVENLVAAIQDINSSNNSITEEINATNKELENIINLIQDIGNKTKVINDIVFQTKLLSFNASVEAARAGEQGKGFAVVAEEVGNLAAMSGNASLEITEILNNSIKTVQDTISKSKSKISVIMNVSSEKILVGNRVAVKCENVFAEILEKTTIVTRKVNEISIASKEQAIGVGEINKAVAQLDQVTHQNTASASQSASAANSLSSLAQELNGAIQELVSTVNGKS